MDRFKLLKNDGYWEASLNDALPYKSFKSKTKRDTFIKHVLLMKNELIELSEDETKTKQVSSKQNVSMLDYIYDNARPIMMGILAAIIFNSTFNLIETIIVKIALIIN